MAVNDLLAQPDLPPMRLQITREGQPRLEVAIDISSMVGSPEPLFARPNNPLNVIVRPEGVQGDYREAFDEPLGKLWRGHSFGNLVEYLRNYSNRRNLLLYASEGGIPTVKIDRGFISDKLERVNRFGMIAIAIMQDEERHLLVQHCVDVAIRVLPRLQSEENSVSRTIRDYYAQPFEADLEFPAPIEPDRDS